MSIAKEDAELMQVDSNSAGLLVPSPGYVSGDIPLGGSKPFTGAMPTNSEIA